MEELTETSLVFLATLRAPDRGGYFDFRFKNFNYSALNYMLWVLIGIVSLRRFK